MKKFLSFALILSVLLASCSGISADLTEFNTSEYTLAYPSTYTVSRAATRVIFKDANGDKALTMYRYLAETPDEVIAQMQSVSKTCKYSKGGTKFGGYKSYTVTLDESVAGAECDLEGSLVANGDGMFVLFIENGTEIDDLVKALKSSFEFIK